jgi:uncharacterized protein YlaI
MSIGIVGGIGVDALADYAIACAVRIRRGNNERTAACKVCDARLATGEGRRAFIAGLVEGQSTHAYLCSECVARVEKCAARFKPATH